ncbi:MAG: hypothetical protein KJI69_01570 [Patescibacteria group bacterium]|nr:hypothetical protein [Patescibacteria group bacterium]
MLKNFLIFILFLILIIFQTTFLVHISIFGIVPNLIFGFIFLYAFFEASGDIKSFWYAIVGGVLLDIFSGYFFGFWVILLLGIVLLVKFVIKSYVRPPILQR